MKSFQQMARDLSKSGEEIAATLTEAEADLWHMATGVAGEAGELLDAVKKHVVYKREIDRENVVEELGDLRFYMAGLMNRLEISEAEILSHNNRKLAKRYATGKFSNAQAEARADKRTSAEDDGLSEVMRHMLAEQFGGEVLTNVATGLKHIEFDTPENKAAFDECVAAYMNRDTSLDPNPDGPGAA